MKEHVTGMVLSSSAIGEYDKRVVLLTKERGRISAFARGARRPKSPLSASTEPFTFGEFYIYRGRDSYSVEQIETGHFFPELRKDLDALCIALYFCEVAQYFTREGIQAGEELNLLYISFRALTVPSIPRELVRRIYEFRMLHMAGVAPRIFACAKCGGTKGLHHFYPTEALVMCDGCSGEKKGIELSETAVYTLQRILSSPLDKLYTFTVNDNVLEEVKTAVERYFDLHTERKFRSLTMFPQFSP